MSPFVSLHWLPVAASIKFKTLMLAYRTATGSAPSYFHLLMTIYIPFRSPRSGTKSLSRTFSFTVPGWWNDLLTPVRKAETLIIFKRHLKTLLFHHHLTSAPSSSFKKKKKKPCSLSLTSPCLTNFALNNAWNFVWQALPVTVCLFIMYHLLYSSVVSRFG